MDCLLDEQEPVCFFDHLGSAALQSLDGFAVGYKKIPVEVVYSDTA